MVRLLLLQPLVVGRRLMTTVRAPTEHHPSALLLRHRLLGVVPPTALHVLSCSRTPTATSCPSHHHGADEGALAQWMEDDCACTTALLLTPGSPVQRLRRPLCTAVVHPHAFSAAPRHAQRCVVRCGAG